MTTVDILFYCATRPTERAALALSSIREVYGIRGLDFDQTAGTLKVEYDATRLNAATVTRLIRQAGLDVLVVGDEEQAVEIAPADATAVV